MSAASHIPLQVLKEHSVVPLGEENGAFRVGAVHTVPDSLLKELAFLIGKEVVQESISQAEAEAFFQDKGSQSALETNHIDTEPGYERTQPVITKGSTVQQVDQLIGAAIKMGASDIHVEPYESRFRVRYRLDGVLQDQGELLLARREAITSRLKIMAGLDIAEKRRPQDGRIRFDHAGKTIDLRVSTLPTDFGEKIVLRILDKSSVNLRPQSLGFSTQQMDAFRRAISLPYGMILVTGPTGSGKTTTLYAALSELNTPHVNITTIEDPIEYNIAGINQTHVRADIGLTFSQALRAFLRQDPNIIMVGEMRDSETVDIAIRAALTGHLVLSTLHTNDAPSTLSRLSDMGVAPYLVASSVKLVIAQRLVRRICQHCKSESQLDSDLARQLRIPEHTTVSEGLGCHQCHGTGYKGRIALFEIMPISEPLAEAINHRRPANELRHLAQSEGMKTLSDAAISALKEGITSVHEVLRETNG